MHQAEYSTSTTPLEDSVRILGMKWDTQDDYLFFDLSEIAKYIHTLPPMKRSLLRVSAKLFDPLGLLSLFSICIKMRLQGLCLCKKKWDENLEGEHLHMETFRQTVQGTWLHQGTKMLCSSTTTCIMSWITWLQWCFYESICCSGLLKNCVCDVQQCTECPAGYYQTDQG